MAFDPRESWDELQDLLIRGGASHYGESITQLEHALQSAHLARQAGADPDEVMAALFHDVGHLIAPDDAMSDLGADNHEDAGARYLEAKGFGEVVVSLVGRHVEAKRYLVWRDTRYSGRLSSASQRTLELQGGRMDDAEAHAFARSPRFRSYLRLRSWDDRAKIEGLEVPGLEAYGEQVLDHLSRQKAGGAGLNLVN